MTSKSPFKWRHFIPDIILWGVRWYYSYPLSYRQLEEMMCDRGVEVDHSTLSRWVQNCDSFRRNRGTGRMTGKDREGGNLNEP